MVTHDKELAKKYVNKIINMKDGKIIDIEENIALYSKDRLSIIKLSPETIKSKLPLKFCFGHSINSIKRRKWRTALIVLMTSFGLIGVGLGALITDIISTNLYNSYSSLIDDDKIVMTPKSINSKKKIVYSATNEDVKLLKNNFSSEIKHDGVYYQNNFLNFFD